MLNRHNAKPFNVQAYAEQSAIDAVVEEMVSACRTSFIGAEAHVLTTMQHIIKECITISSWLENRSEGNTFFYYENPVYEVMKNFAEKMPKEMPYNPERTFIFDKSIKGKLSNPEIKSLTSIKIEAFKGKKVNFPTLIENPAQNRAYIAMCHGYGEQYTGSAFESVVNLFIEKIAVLPQNIYIYLGPYEQHDLSVAENAVIEKRSINTWLETNLPFIQSKGINVIAFDKNSVREEYQPFISSYWFSTDEYRRTETLMVNVLTSNKNYLRTNLIENVKQYLSSKYENHEKQQLLLLMSGLLLFENINEPLLHISMRLYAVVTQNMLKELVLKMNNFLLKNGDSAYFTKNEAGLTALEYAEKFAPRTNWKDWDLYILILKNTAVRTSFANEVKSKILSYCKTSLADNNISDDQINSIQLRHVADIVEGLAIACQRFSDIELLNQVRDKYKIMSEQVHADALFYHLKKIIESVNRGTLRIRGMSMPTGRSGLFFPSSAVAPAGESVNEFPKIIEEFRQAIEAKLDEINKRIQAQYPGVSEQTASQNKTPLLGNFESKRKLLLTLQKYIADVTSDEIDMTLFVERISRSIDLARKIPHQGWITGYFGGESKTVSLISEFHLKLKKHAFVIQVNRARA